MSTPLPAAFQARLQRRNVIQPTVSVVARYGAESQVLTIVGGSVTIDRRRLQRTTATLSVEVKGDVPGILTPLGTDVDLRAGLRLIDGTEADVPLGTGMTVTSVSGVVQQGATLSVQLAERSQRVRRWRFEQPFIVPAGTDLAQVVASVLNNRGYVCTLANTGAVIGVSRVFGLESNTDPWDETVKLAESFGWRLWVGRDGQPVLDQPPALTPPARDVLVITPNMNLAGEPANLVVGRWEPTDGSAPVHAIAEDTDPASKTFVGGPYGRATRFYASSLPISQAGADQAVQTMLEGERFQGASWTWQLPFDPTIDPDDVLRDNTGSVPTVQVDAMTIDLRGGTTVEGREVPQ